VRLYRPRHENHARRRRDYQSRLDRSLKIFGEVLNKFEVPEKEQQELAVLLLPLEKDVVNKQ
jgi:hypothetical protein